MEILFDIIAYILPFSVSLLILFFVMKAAVKSAFDDMNIRKDSESEIDSDINGLIKLRDIELLSDDELEALIGIYKDKKVKKENYVEYEKYSAVLNELKETEYFNHEQYSERSNRLKKHYNIDQ